MAKFTIPNSQGQVRQVNQGDIFGELWGTFNIDLTSSKGKIKTAKQLLPSISQVQMDNDDLLASLVYNGYIYNILSGDRYQKIQAYRNISISGNWLSSMDGNLDFGAETDAVVYNGQLLASGSTDIAMNNNAGSPSWDYDWWTNTISGTALTAGVPHTMNVSSIGQETLFVTDGNLVRYYNDTANHSVVTLSSHLTACCLATDYKATFVGTYSNSGNARVYEIYVGEQLSGTPVARNSYGVDGTAVLSMDVIDGAVYIVTDRGHIQVFNGVAFVTVGSFPFAFDAVAIDGMSIGAIKADNRNRGIHPKGMRAYGKSLYIYVNTNNQLIEDLAANPEDDDDSFKNVVVNERSPSGVWEFDTETLVLNHRYSIRISGDQIGYHRLQASSPINILNNQHSRILVGGRTSSTRTDVFIEDVEETPTSYFITPEIGSANVQDAWANLALKTEVLDDNENITIKYRTSKVVGYPLTASGTFLSADTFNTTEDMSAVSVGDEIELLDGTYAGKMAHVTSVSKSENVYTIVLDTSIATAGEACYARFQNWHKVTSEDFGQFTKAGLGEQTTWVQFKVVLVGNIEVRTFTNRGNSKSEV